MMLHNPRNILGLDGDGWLRNITVNDAIVGLAILQSGAGAGLTIANAGGVKATITAAGKARFGDATAPTVSLEAASGLTVAAGNLTVAAGIIRPVGGILTYGLELNCNANEPALAGAYRMATYKSAIVYHTHTASEFDAAGLTDSATIFTLPANAQLLNITIILDTRFVAVGLTDLDITIGTAGDNSGVLNPPAMNLVTDALNSRYCTVGGFYGAFTEGVSCATRTAIAFIAYVTAVGANLNTTSAGVLRYCVEYLDFN